MAVMLIYNLTYSCMYIHIYVKIWTGLSKSLKESTSNIQNIRKLYSDIEFSELTESVRVYSLHCQFSLSNNCCKSIKKL